MKKIAKTLIIALLLMGGAFYFGKIKGNKEGVVSGQKQLLSQLRKDMSDCTSPLVIYSIYQDGFDYLCAIDDPNYDEDENILWLEKEEKLQ